MLTEPPNNPISNRIRTAQLFFENYQVPKLFFHTSAVLSLYARGLTTGVVLDVGDGVTHASAICEGFSITNATKRIDLGGRDITDHLTQLLQRSGYSFRTTAEQQIVRKIKEMHCNVEVHEKKYENEFAGFSAFKNSKDKLTGLGGTQRKLDTETRAGIEMENTQNPNDYTLPDGEKITLSQHDKSKAPEILFRPSLIGLEYPGIHELVHNCIKSCDIDLRAELSSNIVVAGSTTMMKSFCARLHKQIKQMFPKNNSKVTLLAPANRHISCWAGGSTICELNSFDKMWISKKQFEQEDGRILAINCM